MTLGQSLTRGIEDEWHMSMRRRGDREQFGDEQLPRCAVEQIVAAHDLTHPLGMVIDNDHQVVGRHTIGTTHHEVIDGTFIRTHHGIDETEPAPRTAHTQWGPTSCGLALGPLTGIQISTGADIGERRSMRCPGCRLGIGEDLPAGAEARIGLARGFQCGEGYLVFGTSDTGRDQAADLPLAAID